jgi:hypothetical protein
MRLEAPARYVYDVEITKHQIVQLQELLKVLLQ